MTETARQVDYVLIGVDGGATEVKAHAVACDDPDDARSFELRAEAASRKYERFPGFQPVPLTKQLAQRDGGCTGLSAQEDEQGALWIDAAGEAVAEVVERCGVRRALVGMGMPGLKTPDGRGICAINNGPRIPDYLDDLEKDIVAAGVELASPVAALGSDADYCGLGEQYAADGLFRDVVNAYYVGCGTGIADAMKLHGKLVPFDHAKSWIQKSWQIVSALGPTFEKLVSAKSLNRVYADLIGATKRPSDEATKRSEPEARARANGGVTKGTLACASGSEPATMRYPETAAAAGSPAATAWMATAALVLAELVFERLWTIKNGRADAPHRGDAYAKLDVNHEFRGTLLDRVIIGQRVGEIYGDAAFHDFFGAKADGCLAALIAGSEDTEMCEAYLRYSAGPPSPAQLKPALVLSSKLRAAPALGAAVAAVRALGATNI